MVGDNGAFEGGGPGRTTSSVGECIVGQNCLVEWGLQCNNRHIFEAKRGREVLFGNYTGGADATLLRCLFRKAAHEAWTLGSIDVKTAFLLAPRQKAKESLLVAVPPRVLVEAGIVKESGRWIIDKAMYGLDSSPADWRIYRDSMLQKFKWNLNGVQHELRSTPEGNLWQVIACPTNGDEYAAGYVAVYVGDLLAVGPDDGSAQPP